MRHRVPLMLATTFAITLLVGCGPTQAPPGPSPSTSETVTSTAPVTTTPLPEPAGSPVAFNVYFALNEKMQPAPRTAPAGTKAVLRAAIEALLAGPTSSEKTGELFTAVPADTRLLGVSINANVAVIDLNGEFDSGGGSLSMFTRLAQMVFTATQFPGVDAVTFKIDGKKVDVFGGEGIIIDRPQTRKAFEDSSPAILVERPAWRGTLTNGATIRGTANVFEAVFRLQIRDSSGKLVMDRTVQAASGTGTRGAWKVTAALSKAKAGLGTLRVFADSPKDGSPINQVTVPVLLQP